MTSTLPYDSGAKMLPIGGPFPPKIDNVRVSPSRLMEFLNCKMYARYRVKGIYPLTPSPVQLWGHMFHRICELAIPQRATQGKKLFAVIEQVEKEFKKKHGARWGERETQKFELQIAQLEAVAPAYFDFWRETDRDLEWEEQEYKFEVPLNNEITLNGVMDGVLKGKKKRKVLFERKTKGRIIETEIYEVLERDFQTMFYLLVLFLVHGTVPEKVLYDITRRPGEEFSVKNDRTLANYTKRIAEKIKRDPEHFFLRFEMPVDEEMLAAFDIELRVLTHDFLMWRQNNMPAKLFGNPCVGKYGLCPYVPLCYRGETFGYTKEKGANDEKKKQNNKK